MTPTQQLGYNDQKAGKLDPDLSRADNPKGREYRDGMRARRRDENDAIMRDGIEFATDRTRQDPTFIPPATPIEPEVFHSLYQQEPWPADRPAPDPLGRAKKEIAAVMGVPEHLTREAPVIIAPVYEKKRSRKAKPGDADQSTFL